jgi:predicted nucleic acid-binding protein
VATRLVKDNGLELSVDEAKLEIDKIKQAFVVYADPLTILNEWEKLVVAHDCKGKTSHDARIVAAMNLHDVTQILTFNIRDFTRFGSIKVLDPQQIAAVP